MSNSKLGVNVGLLGAAVCFAAFFGCTPLLLLAGYVLLAEDNAWLRHTTLKVLVLFFGLTILSNMIQLVPDCLGWISSLVAVFDGSFDYDKINAIIKVILKALDIIQTILLLGLGTKAVHQGTIAIPFVDKFLS